MIKSSFGSTQMQGSVDMILTYFSCITDSLKDFLTQRVGMDEEMAKEAIRKAYETGFMTEEEVEQEAERLEQQAKAKKDDVKEELAKLFGTLAKAMKGGESE